MLVAMTQLPTPQGEPQTRSARALATSRARRRRARSIRRAIIGGALSLFVAAWLLIAIVLVSGHDPALAAHVASTRTRLVSASPATPSASAATPAATTATSTTTASTTASSTANAQSPSASSGAGAVTTRQS
jgi:cytoskeletal protein RodZ